MAFNLAKIFLVVQTCLHFGVGHRLTCKDCVECLPKVPIHGQPPPLKISQSICPNPDDSAEVYWLRQIVFLYSELKDETVPCYTSCRKCVRWTRKVCNTPGNWIHPLEEHALKLNFPGLFQEFCGEGCEPVWKYSMGYKKYHPCRGPVKMKRAISDDLCCHSKFDESAYDGNKTMLGQVWYGVWFCNDMEGVGYKNYQMYNMVHCAFTEPCEKTLESRKRCIAKKTAVSMLLSTHPPWGACGQTYILVGVHPVKVDPGKTSITTDKQRDLTVTKAPVGEINEGLSLMFERIPFYNYCQCAII